MDTFARLTQIETTPERQEGRQQVRNMASQHFWRDSCLLTAPRIYNCRPRSSHNSSVQPRAGVFGPYYSPTGPLRCRRSLELRDTVSRQACQLVVQTAASLRRICLMRSAGGAGAEDGGSNALASAPAPTTERSCDSARGVRVYLDYSRLRDFHAHHKRDTATVVRRAY
jgi:hypothetical protein